MCGPADFGALAVSATRITITLAFAGGLALAWRCRWALSSAAAFLRQRTSLRFRAGKAVNAIAG